jgi:hypothetical protein
MKKLILILFLLIFASSASATVYKWLDDRGILNFTDDIDNVPAAYQNDVARIEIPKTLAQLPSQRTVAHPTSGESRRQNPPPVAQVLVREGDFAIKLVEALKVGRTRNEAEAESILASAGIAPRNGWIADYPMTPDVVGELQDTVLAAADSGILAMNEDEAMRVFQDLTAQQGLPVGSDNDGQVAEGEPLQNDDEYYNPEAVDNYYNDQGPPVVTYYPPPPDYRYLYVWVPYPFRCSGSHFRGFFVLNDFHRFVFVNGKRMTVTNHRVDPKTKRISRIDPRTRRIGYLPGTNVSHAKRETSPEVRRSASSIFERSQSRSQPRNSASIGTGRGPAGRTSGPSVKNSSSPTLRDQVAAARTPISPQTSGRNQTATGPERSGNSHGGTTVSGTQASPGSSHLAGAPGGSSPGSAVFSGGSGGRR